VAVEHTSVHPIDRARENLGHHPLLAADLALLALGATRGHRSDTETGLYLDVLATAIIAANSCPDAGREDPVTAMLSEGTCDSLATAALLRLLVLDEDVFTDDERLRPAIALFDRVLDARLYASAGTAIKDQAFEKRAKLRNAVAEHEIAFQAHVDSLGSLDALASFRQQLSQLFKDQVTQVTVRPFIPGVTIQTLNEVLTAVQAVVEAGNDQVLERAEAASRRCRLLSAQAAEIGTAYARGLVGGLAATLQDLVAGELRGRGLADPATVSVAARPKTYPLGHAGAPVVLRLVVANEGPGHARDVALSIDGHQHVAFEDTTRSLGLLAPGARRVDVRGAVSEATSSDVVLVRVTWRNPDGSECEYEHLVELRGQGASVDWAALEYEDPYPLEAITDAGRFIGRDAVLHTLTKTVLGATPGNARVQGQRRVGKTSVANALPARVEGVRPGVYKFVYVQSGDFNANTPEKTVERLGAMIADRVRACDLRLTAVPVPEFAAGLSPMTEFFAAAERLAPDLRFVLVLDEFDAMPHPELYDHGPVATAFVQTLRSLGSKPNVGIVLIGGERMRFVIATHGQALNRFQLVPLDYFNNDQYQDYVALLRDPVKDWLLIDEEAIALLHEQTAGNPWITKSIAGQLFDRHRANRDADVRVDDMADAIADAIPRLGAPSFQHFWDDAIQGGVEDQRHVSLIRRKVLLAVASCLRDRGPVSEDAIIRAARRYEVDGPNALDVLRGFSERSILLAAADGNLHFRVPLFARWLADEGVREIVITMGDDDALIRRQRAEEAVRPKPAELAKLATAWRTYGGRLLEATTVKEWLQQFGHPREQRFMLRLLQGLRYYTHEDVHERLRRLHGFVVRELAEAGHEYRFTGQKRYRDDMVVCGLEGGGSGAGHLVNPYRHENAVYKERVVDASGVREAIATAEGRVRAVVVLEDFIATGGTAQDQIKQLNRMWTADEPWPADVPVYLLGICGFDKAVSRVQRAADALPVPMTVHVTDELDDTDRVFHQESAVFPEEADRDRAREIAYERGVALEPKHPLGHEDTQALVCFEANCPNNTLPILYKSGPNWNALFPRG
jgi:hypothetical protein